MLRSVEFDEQQKTVCRREYLVERFEQRVRRMRANEDEETRQEVLRWLENLGGECSVNICL